ncbi:hypothetical protein [Mechercharimyces sp. CAU 1602]|uniref:hypothetical protein n=1 Tax=Mechercharimyces sp. CAU 1602 TaxID=2973933 RepID=UPI002163C407|nr:hypothetical protein [Mechercharimyces sp. CAU 1602]MCS1351161.1 hypothetical protein [Mechercharimyces sp. CAU 1602]
MDFYISLLMFMGIGVLTVISFNEVKGEVKILKNSVSDVRYSLDEIKPLLRISKDGQWVLLTDVEEVALYQERGWVIHDVKTLPSRRCYYILKAKGKSGTADDRMINITGVERLKEYLENGWNVQAIYPKPDISGNFRYTLQKEGRVQDATNTTESL